MICPAPRGPAGLSGRWWAARLASIITGGAQGCCKHRATAGRPHTELSRRKCQQSRGRGKVCPSVSNSLCAVSAVHPPHPPTPPCVMRFSWLSWTFTSRGACDSIIWSLYPSHGSEDQVDFMRQASLKPIFHHTSLPSGPRRELGCAGGRTQLTSLTSPSRGLRHPAHPKAPSLFA